jgi:hypothetical protein
MDPPATRQIGVLTLLDKARKTKLMRTEPMAENVSPYEAYPLQSHEEAIRLLLLQPGRWDETISCKFKIISLKDPHPAYEALSYVWGDQKDCEEIGLEGHTVKVTNNLFKALRRLRRAGDIRTIWVDALCINQSDVREKSAQVSLMGRIYRSTAEVCIWLGDYTTDPQNTPRDTRTVEETNDLPWYGQPGPNQGEFDGGFGAFAVVWEFAQSSRRHLNEIPLFVERAGGLAMASPSAQQAIEAFVSVMNVAWWRRIWVIQETILPPRATVILGSVQMLWEGFAVAATCMEIHAKCCAKLLLSLPNGLYRAIEQFIINVMEIAHTRLSRQRDNHSQRLYDLLWQYRCHRATDPRDMVFALRSFIRDADAHVELNPDYTLSKLEVYKRAMMYSMRSSTKLDILRGQRTPNSSMPSWIYDWGSSMDDHEWHLERQRLRNSEYKASAEEDMSVSCNGNYALELKGILVDTVVTVGPVVEISDYRDIELKISIWRQLADLPTRDSEPYIRGEDRKSAFWRTVTRDYSFNDELDFERVADVEKHTTSASVWWARVTDESRNQSATDATQKFERLVGNIVVGQQFFLTQEGYMGLGNPRPGDKVFVLLGGDVPFLLRPRSNAGGFLLVGDAYVHGIMDGEVLGGERRTVVLH